MRSTASRSTSGEQPKLMRTWPLPSSPNSGPRCSATFASRRIFTAGLSPQPSVGQVDPREEPGIRDAIARARNVLGEQVGEQTAVVVERGAQPVEPRVALLRERGHRRERAEQTGAPLDLGRQRAHDAERLLRRGDHERALQTGEVVRLARARDRVADRGRRRATHPGTG